MIKCISRSLMICLMVTAFTPGIPVVQADMAVTGTKELSKAIHQEPGTNSTVKLTFDMVDSENLIVNGDFEQGSALWTSYSGTQFSILNDSINGGTKALKVTAPNGGAKHDYFTNGVTPNALYTFEAWGKTEGGTSPAWISVEFNSGGTKDLTYTETAYTKKSMSFRAPSNVVSMRPFFWKNATPAAIYGDALKLTKKVVTATGNDYYYSDDHNRLSEEKAPAEGQNKPAGYNHLLVAGDEIARNNGEYVNVVEVDKANKVVAFQSVKVAASSSETTFADIQSLSLTNGLATISLDAEPTTDPAAADFAAGYVTDIDPTAHSLTMTDFQYDRSGKRVLFHFAPIGQLPVQQTITFNVLYRGSTATGSFLVAASGAPEVTANVESISASNGKVYVLLDKQPTAAPKIQDFKVEYTSNLTAQPMNLNIVGYEYAPELRRETLLTNPIAKTDQQQSVTVSVTYKGSPTVAEPFIIKSSALGTSYYIDSEFGNDTNDGESPASAWKTLGKINGVTFLPGDQILFKAGGIWNGQLHPQGSGAEGRVIAIGMYGEGKKPLIQGGGIESAVYLYNQQYWDIGDLEITNYSPVPATAARRGVLVSAEDFEAGATNDLSVVSTLHHIHLHDLFVHDVNGQDNKDANGSAGIQVSVKISGMDGNAIPATGSVHRRTTFDDVVIENNIIENVSRTGIITWTDWKSRTMLGDNIGYGNSASTPWTPITGVLIRGNKLTNIGGDGIAPHMTDEALVEHNTLHGYNKTSSGYNAGMWTWDGDRTLYQYNEVSGGFSTRDGMSFDFDHGSKGVIYQYNYSHDNDGGTLLLCSDGRAGGVYDGIFRYNISQNDKYQTFTVCGAGNVYNVKIYNNVFYVGEGLNTNLLVSQGGATQAALSNNIFYNKGTGRYTKKASWTYDHNLFFGNNAPAAGVIPDAAMLVADPLFVNPGSGSAINSLDGYKLQPDSPAIGSGALMDNNGGKDFWGNPISAVTQNRGAYGAVPSVSGTTLSGADSALAGSEFTVRFGLKNVTQSVYGQDIKLKYDANVMAFVTAKSTENGISIVQSKDQAGDLRVIIASQGVGNAVTGTSEFAEIVFKAKNVQQSAAGLITVVEATLADDKGVEWNVDTSSITIQVTPVPVGIPGDVNGDNKVSIGDLGFAAAHYGETSISPNWQQVKAADINNDGRIDISDLAAIANKIIN